MGIVMGSFSIASVLGVPAGLELAELGTWQTPFYATGLLGLATAFLTARNLPRSISSETDRHGTEPFSFWKLISRTEVLQTYLMGSMIMLSIFLLIPNIAAFVQGNLHYPRTEMGRLYMAGGIVSFIGMRVSGRLADRLGVLSIALIGSVGVIAAIYGSFVHSPSLGPWFLFIGFMLATSFRNISYNTLVSRVPRSHERAGFMSVQSSVQHISSASGAFLSANFLTSNSNQLIGIDKLGSVAIAMSILVPILFFLVHQRVNKTQ